MTGTLTEAVEELAAEQAALASVLRGLDASQWSAPTPAEPWDVRDQITHLAYFDEVAVDTATGGLHQINEEAQRYGFDSYTEAVRQLGLQLDAAEMLRWYEMNAARLQVMFLTKDDPKERVPWGLGMSLRTLVTARLMEHWAHGLDVRAAVGVPVEASPRLRSIAWLITQSFPYAFSVAEVEMPARTLRVELTMGDDVWAFGPDDAEDEITGDALEFCKVGVQRLKREDAHTLKARGPLADLALVHARAFL